jgi:hypothetical protein
MAGDNYLAALTVTKTLTRPPVKTFLLPAKTGSVSRFRNMLLHSLPLDYLGTLHVLDLFPATLARVRLAVAATGTN